MTKQHNGIMALVCFGLAVACFIGLLVTVARADDATLSWTANTEADLSGYKIYRGTTATICANPSILPPLLSGTTPVQVGKITSYLDAPLPAVDATFCWEISAFDTAGNESGRSNRVTRILNNLPPLAPAGLNAVIQ